MWGPVPPCCWGEVGTPVLCQVLCPVKWHSALLTWLFLFVSRVIYPLSDSPSLKMSQSSPADEGTTFEHLWSTL